MKGLERSINDSFLQVPVDDSEVIRKHSKSFSTAALLLPKSLRSDAERLYAWCRWCDDAVDAAPDKDTAMRQLKTLRDDVDAIFDGKPTQHGASRWLTTVVRRHAIPRQIFHDLLDGMEMDVDHHPPENEYELDLYCYRAAGSVGVMMAYLLGASHKQAIEKAKSLGMAMQMTNIARDVVEDWGRGRCYLPVDWWEASCPTSALPSDPQFRPAVKKLLTRADRFYAEGFAGLRELPDSVRPAIRLAARLYREIGNGIRSRNYGVTAGRYVVPWLRKSPIVLAGLTQLFGQSAGGQVQRFISSLQRKLNDMKTPSSDAAYLAALGLSLTLIMASALFILVGVNPKSPEYTNLPWLYSALSASLAGVAHVAARMLVRQPS